MFKVNIECWSWHSKMNGIYYFIRHIRKTQLLKCFDAEDLLKYKYKKGNIDVCLIGTYLVDLKCNVSSWKYLRKYFKAY